METGQDKIPGIYAQRTVQDRPVWCLRHMYVSTPVFRSFDHCVEQHRPFEPFEHAQVHVRCDLSARARVRRACAPALRGASTPDRFSNNLSQALLSKQFVPGTAFQTICHSVLCPMLRRRSSSMSRACGSACSYSPAMEVLLSKQFVPSNAFQTICLRH